MGEWGTDSVNFGYFFENKIDNTLSEKGGLRETERELVDVLITSALRSSYGTTQVHPG